MSLSLMSHVEFKKHSYRPVEFRGQGPVLRWKDSIEMPKWGAKLLSWKRAVKINHASLPLTNGLAVGRSCWPRSWTRTRWAPAGVVTSCRAIVTNGAELFCWCCASYGAVIPDCTYPYGCCKPCSVAIWADHTWETQLHPCTLWPFRLIGASRT